MTNSCTERGTGGKWNLLSCVTLVAILSLFLTYVDAAAVEIPTGNSDLSIRWDNTFRYSGAYRVADQSSQLLDNPNADDGDRNFKDGLVGNRLDIFSQMDLIYKRKYGFRLSGDGWFDTAYAGGFDNTSTATSNHLENGQPVAGGLDDEANRLYRGPSGELLDAFAFGKFNLGNDTPLNIKLGRHTVYWGESLMFGGAIQGIAYGQSPLDISKALTQPGAKANELFRPLNQLTFQVQPTNDLTFMGQYFLQWDSFRYPEAGTYLGFSDAVQRSAESLIAGPGQRMISGPDSKPNSHDNWGLGLRYSPQWLDGTFGMYYRKFADMQPQLAIRPTAATLPTAVGGALGYTQLTNTGGGYDTFAFNPADIPDIAAGRVGNYYQTYGEDVDLIGVSLAKELFGVSVGSELSYRWNMPLISSPVMILPAPLAAGTPGAIDYIPTDGQTAGARGDTVHGVLNLLGVTGPTPLFDDSTWAAELTWNRYVRVTQNRDVFKSEESGYHGIDAATKDFFGLAVSYTPTWYQALPGVDLTLPLSYSRGLSGNSAIAAGGNHDSGIWSAGLGADVFNKYKVDLKYIDFYGEIGSDLTPNGSASAGLKDRDMITLTLSTTF